MCATKCCLLTGSKSRYFVPSTSMSSYPSFFDCGNEASCCFFIRGLVGDLQFGLATKILAIVGSDIRRAAKASSARIQTTFN